MTRQPMSITEAIWSGRYSVEVRYGGWAWYHWPADGSGMKSDGPFPTELEAIADLRRHLDGEVK